MRPFLLLFLISALAASSAALAADHPERFTLDVVNGGDSVININSSTNRGAGEACGPSTGPYGRNLAPNEVAAFHCDTSKYTIERYAALLTASTQDRNHIICHVSFYHALGARVSNVNWNRCSIRGGGEHYTVHISK